MQHLTAIAVLLSLSMVTSFCSAATTPAKKDQDYWRDMEGSSQGASTVSDKTKPAARAQVGTTRPVSAAQPASPERNGSRKTTGVAERTDQ